MSDLERGIRPDSVQLRRDRVAAAWSLGSEIVLISAGDLLGIPGRGDQTYPYKSHSEYFYLTDRDRPGAVLAFDPHEGWTDFVPEVTQKARVWTGERPSKGTTPRSQLEAWLKDRGKRMIALLGCTLPDLELNLEIDTDLTQQLRDQLLAVRRPKDPYELDLMRQAAQATQKGYAAIQGLLRPGVTERQIQIELETAFLRAGGHGTAYDTIVGFGSNAAVLHFSPTDRKLKSGEMILIDAGAEVRNYACDVSRTYPCRRLSVQRFSPEQRDLYSIVLEAQKNAVDRCLRGKEYTEIHLETVHDLTRGLVDFGLLLGDPDSLVEQETHELFFPHGVGHMVGLGVRDCSGMLPGRSQSKQPGLRKLKMNMPLDVGYVVTIEPGIYIIPALLDDSENRQKHRDNVAWDRVDQMRDFGGIRIEDNVLVTEGDPEILTAAIPKDLS